MAKLSALAQIIRSKNAGANLLTLDIIFEDAARFEQVRRTGVLNRALFARLYGVAEADVQFIEYPQAYAFKGTLPRQALSGDPADRDIYGAQQHAPLLDVEVPLG
ncbi:MAG: DUF4387 domain-containing protein [Candidatus Lambdaproteobacteria bacterium]|nr:DUF4387 domain-containing protein [Candidatus Lambdaproteobacteria bacterium]